MDGIIPLCISKKYTDKKIEELQIGGVISKNDNYDLIFTPKDSETPIILYTQEELRGIGIKSITKNEDGDTIKLSVPKKLQQNLTLVKNGLSSIYNGESAVVVDLATELSAGENISIVDNKINCTLSVDVPLSVS